MKIYFLAASLVLLCMSCDSADKGAEEANDNIPINDTSTEDVSGENEEWADVVSEGSEEIEEEIDEQVYMEGNEVVSQGVCGEDDTLCLTLMVPASLNETPDKLIIGLYKSLPPMGPPDIFPPFSVDMPAMPSGGTLDVVLSVTPPGTDQVYAVVYMPGGGVESWQAMSGIDYVGTSEALELGGPSYTLESPIELSILE